jgi:bifunctional enzyme CysN/CysC
MSTVETTHQTKESKEKQVVQTKDLLRFITCGSVDDGKSTLIGRLLYETGVIFENEVAALKKDSDKFGTQGAEIDYALLVDGLTSEREQGITIDVAYRYFGTSKRKFIVADTPGHEQYTRNMATAASNASLAVIMVDARKGLLKQTKRHSFIASLFGIKKVIVAVNKMDMVNFDQAIFDEISDEYINFANHLEFDDIHLIPVSALNGDNLVSKSSLTPWYQGEPLLTSLENTQLAKASLEQPFRFCVQWVNRPNLDFRGYTGTVNQGTLQKGQAVTILPQNKQSEIKEIVTFDDSLMAAHESQAVTLVLKDEIDITRGDVICPSNQLLETADTFQVTLLWMVEKPLVSGRQYLFKSGTNTTNCTPLKLKHQIDLNNMQTIPAKQLTLNEIGVCELSLSKAIAFDAFKNNKTLGSFILIDRLTNETAAAGTINFALRRAGNIHKQSLSVTPDLRSEIKGHKPCALWFTGISGAGKSTIANALEKMLNMENRHTVLLDGDNVRFGLNKDLGFTEKDRAENIRRIAEVSKLMNEAGLITLVSFISPFVAEREMARELIGRDNFIEIFVDTTLFAAEKRDVKGLYKKARAGEIKNFTGIDSPYEAPLSPDIRIKTDTLSPDEAALTIIQALKEKEII